MTQKTTIPEDKPHRVNEILVGDTLFTVISVESNRARERLYDKVKRMILDSDTQDVSNLQSAA